LIEGVGFAFAENVGGRSTWLRRLIVRRALNVLFRISLGDIDRLLVLNQDDEKAFLKRGLVDARRLTRIDGIGVDLARYTAAPPVTEPITFTLAARLIREKGVADFVVAARAIKRRRPDVRFVILGAVDDNPSAITFDEMAQHVADGVIEWPGHLPDIRGWLARTSVYVLPSRYGEGRPRSIMEAMAMGRPVITSAAVAGCRDSITEGVSGYLVQLDAADTLRRAMEAFIDDPDRIVRMGRAARLECERRYDARSANEALIAALFEPRSGPERDPDAAVGPAGAGATTAVATMDLEPSGSRS
jgi:glycosyltransferase involved in cell wall biosynthesis